MKREIRWKRQADENRLPVAIWPGEERFKGAPQEFLGASIEEETLTPLHC